MVKGFSDNKVKNDNEIKESKKEKKGLASFLKGKKFTYTLPGKKQIIIFGSIVSVSYTHLTLPTICSV